MLKVLKMRFIENVFKMNALYGFPLDRLRYFMKSKKLAPPATESCHDILAEKAPVLCILYFKEVPDRIRSWVFLCFYNYTRMQLYAEFLHVILTSILSTLPTCIQFFVVFIRAACNESNVKKQVFFFCFNAFVCFVI